MDWLKRLAVVAISAIILSFVIPIPISTGIAVFLALVLFQLIGERFRTGIATAREWAGVAAAVVSALGIFIILRLIAWRVVGIAPTVSRETWDMSGGLAGIFWGKNPMPVFLLWEVLFAAVVAGFCVDYAKEKLGHAVATGPRQKLIAFIMVGALALATAKLALPLSYQTGRAHVSDAGMAEKLRGWFEGAAKVNPTGSASGTPAGAAAVPSIPEIRFSCGSGYSAALHKPYAEGVRTVVVVIEEKGCLTPILTRPPGPKMYKGMRVSDDFSSWPEEVAVKEVLHFFDGTSEVVESSSPTSFYNSEKLVTGRAFEVPVGVERPVRVRIDL